MKVGVGGGLAQYPDPELRPVGPIMALQAAVAEYFKEDLPERSQEQVAADLLHFGRLLHQVKLAMATVAGEFVETDEFSRSGRVGPGDWIRVHCNLSRSESYEMIRVGEMLRFDSASREAILEGRIGYGHLSLIESTSKLLASSTVPDATVYSEQLTVNRRPNRVRLTVPKLTWSPRLQAAPAIAFE